MADDAAGRDLKPFLILGMHGMGDNLHMRAIVRQMMSTRQLYVTTSWFSLYHDFAEQGVRIMQKQTPLRTQTKNANRERYLFWNKPVPPGTPSRQVAYLSSAVKRYGSVLHAMIGSFGLDVSQDDFRLPVPQGWLGQVDELICQWKPTKPIMVYRPLVVRREWHFDGRNPDHDAYVRLFRKIRDQFFVISIADLVPKEKSQTQWEVIVSEDVGADVVLHKGELAFEQLAALVKRASLVYCSPGFAVPMAQAVGTPVACMFGGYENSRSFSAGAKYAPYLGMDVIRPCGCFSHQHKCDRRIDEAKIADQMARFLDETANYREARHPLGAVGSAETKILEPGRDRGLAVAS